MDAVGNVTSPGNTNWTGNSAIPGDGAFEYPLTNVLFGSPAGPPVFIGQSINAALILWANMQYTCTANGSLSYRVNFYDASLNLLFSATRTINFVTASFDVRSLSFLQSSHIAKTLMVDSGYFVSITRVGGTAGILIPANHTASVLISATG